MWLLALLLAAAPAQAQLRTAPVRAPILAPTLSAPLLSPALSPSLTLSPALAQPVSLTPTLPAAVPALAASVQPAAPARVVRQTGTDPLRDNSARAVAGVKEAAPAPEKGAETGGAAQAARLDALFDGTGRHGTGRLAADLEAPAAADAVDLDALPTGATPRVKGRRQAERKLDKDLARIVRYQEMLYARGERAVMLVFQGMDTGGKDGVIKVVVGAMNPQGVTVTSFKKPTPEEARHHYLWRIEKAVPKPGGVGVLNRSQYEDILVPTVMKTLPAAEVELRYDEINRFEKALADRGVVILKFFLNVSKAEQKRRLQERLDRPEKNWKFSPSDLESRKKWDDYRAAYARILARTNTPWAPWYVIPADNKWYRDYAVARILRKTLKRLNLSYPPGPAHPERIVIPD